MGKAETESTGNDFKVLLKKKALFNCLDINKAKQRNAGLTSQCQNSKRKINENEKVFFLVAIKH